MKELSGERLKEAVQGNLLKGTFDMMVLLLLSKEDMSPSQIKTHLTNNREAFFTNVNAVYNVFGRLEDSGCISRTRESYRGSILHIEPKGIEYLKLLHSEYRKLNKIIEGIVKR